MSANRQRLFLKTIIPCLFFQRRPVNLSRSAFILKTTLRKELKGIFFLIKGRYLIRLLLLDLFCANIKIFTLLSYFMCFGAC